MTELVVICEELDGKCEKLVKGSQTWCCMLSPQAKAAGWCHDAPERFSWRLQDPDRSPAWYCGIHLRLQTVQIPCCAAAPGSRTHPPASPRRAVAAGTGR